MTEKNDRAPGTVPVLQNALPKETGKAVQPPNAAPEGEGETAQPKTALQPPEDTAPEGEEAPVRTLEGTAPAQDGVPPRRARPFLANNHAFWHSLEKTQAAGAPDGPKTPPAPAGGLRLRRPLLWAALPVLVLAAVMFWRYPLWNTGWPQDRTAAYFAGGIAAAEKGAGRIELNTADFYALCALPGIGEVKAQAILDYRAACGGFTDLEQLLQVHGIGEKTLEALRDWVYLGDA